MGVFSYYNRFIYGIIGTITKLYCPTIIFNPVFWTVLIVPFENRPHYTTQIHDICLKFFKEFNFSL